jgi:hypothetical protein
MRSHGRRATAKTKKPTLQRAAGTLQGDEDTELTRAWSSVGATASTMSQRGSQLHPKTSACFVLLGFSFLFLIFYLSFKIKN